MAVTAIAVGWLSTPAQAEAPAPLPLAVKSHLLALIEAEESKLQTCVNPDALARLVSSASDYAIEITSEAVHRLRTTVPPSTISPQADGRANSLLSQGDPDQPAPAADAQCKCISDIAAAVTPVVPNRAGELYKILAEVSPQCRAAVAERMRHVLVQPGSTATAAAAGARSSGARSNGAGLPSSRTNICADTGTCATPLPTGDTRDESPTRLGRRG